LNALPKYKNNLSFETDFETHVDLPGFFPGAGGFFHDCNPGFSKPFVFFGTDFGELSYQKTLRNTFGEPRTNPTLRNLKKIVVEAGLDLNSCLLTNAVLGLTKGDTAIGNYDSIFKPYPEYLELCAHWHRKMLLASNSRLIVFMGAPHIHDYGARIFPELKEIWSNYSTLKSIYNAGLEFVRRESGADILLMYHPSSYWHLHPATTKQRIISHLSRYAV
jgi:uracil-DNA glycosylase